MSLLGKKKKIILSRNRKTQASETTRPERQSLQWKSQLPSATPRQKRMETAIRREKNSLEIYEA